MKDRNIFGAATIEWAATIEAIFDSSVLIPAFYKFDANHPSSASALRSASRPDFFCALQTLGEVYAVLTGLPVRPQFHRR